MTQPWRRLASSDSRIVILLTLAAAVLRLFRCTHQSLWVDEAFSIKYARLFEEMTWLRFVDDLHGPLHSVLMHGLTRVLGTSELLLRGTEALIGTAAVPALYWALRPMENRKVSLLACALLVVSPYHVWYSQEVRNYALFMLVGILATGSFLRLLARSRAQVRGGTVAGGRTTESRSLWIESVRYGVLNLLGFLSNLAHLFALASHGAVQLFRRTGRRLWIPLVLSWAVTLVLLSPWIVRFWERHIEVSGALDLDEPSPTEPLRGETSAPFMGVPYTYFAFSVGYSLGPTLRELREDRGPAVFRPHLPLLAWSAVAFGVAVVFGVARLARRGVLGRAWIWMLVLPVLLTYGTALRNLKVFNPRYASTAFPAYLLAVAEGIAAPRRRSGQIALGLAVLMPTGVALGQHYFDPEYFKDDARSAARDLRELARPGDLIFVVGTDEPLERYYWPGLRAGVGGIEKGDLGYWWDRPREEKRSLLHQTFDAHRQAHHDVYVLFLRDYHADPDGYWKEYIRTHYPPADIRTYPGVELWIVRGDERGAGR